MTKHISIVMPDSTKSKYASYLTTDGPAGGFWLEIETGVNIFISSEFVKTEILPRLDMVVLPRKRGEA